MAGRGRAATTAKGDERMGGVAGGRGDQGEAAMMSLTEPKRSWALIQSEQSYYGDGAYATPLMDGEKSPVGLGRPSRGVQSLQSQDGHRHHPASLGRPGLIEQGHVLAPICLQGHDQVSARGQGRNEQTREKQNQQDARLPRVPTNQDERWAYVQYDTLANAHLADRLTLQQYRSRQPFDDGSFVFAEDLRVDHQEHLDSKNLPAPFKQHRQMRHESEHIHERAWSEPEPYTTTTLAGGAIAPVTIPSAIPFTHKHQQHQQLAQDLHPPHPYLHFPPQPRQRLRQGSLASDWRFPPMRSQIGHQHSSPRAQALQTPQTPTTSHAPTAPYPHHDRHFQGLHPGQEDSPSAFASSRSPSSSSPSSPSQRRRRDLHFQQNTDPLVYNQFNHNDPVQCTRTLPLPEHVQAQTWASPQSQTCIPAQTQADLPSHSPLALFSPSSDQSRQQHHHHPSVPPRTVDSSRRTEQHQVAQRNQPSQPPTHHNPYTDPYIHSNEALASYRAVDPASPHHPLPLDASLFDQRSLPVTPVSPISAAPRWDLLTPPDRRPDPSARRQPPGVASTSNALVVSASGLPPSPIRSPKSPSFSTGRYSHPLIPEEESLAPETTRYEHAVTTAASGQVDMMYRPDSRQSGDTAHSADNFNFSRPRKPSFKSLNRPDFSGAAMPLRPGTAKSTASESLRLDAKNTWSNNNGFAPYMHYSPTLRRQPSAGSNISSSTHASAVPSLQHHASQDRLGVHRNASQNLPTATSMGLPHMVHPQAPPRSHSRVGPLGQGQQSHRYEDEIRSSVRSHLTASTAQETLFTEPERSSVMTKTSSVFSSGFSTTRQSSFFGPNTPTLEVRDSLSVDDVMGMYENGFNDSEMDLARRLSGIELDRAPAPPTYLSPGGMDELDDSRPGSAVSQSHTGEAATRLLEAMSQPGPMPIPGRSFPLNGDGPVVLRDTNAFFRKSLASSLPKDIRLSFISSESQKHDDTHNAAAGDAEEMDGTFDTDSARHSRHDSGKLVGPRSEENSPIEYSEKHDASVLTATILPPPQEGRLSPQPIMAEKITPPAQHVQGAAQPEDMDPDANDRYGFRKSNQYITREQYDEWNGQYSEYLARRRKKWEAFLKDNGLMTDQPNRFPQHSAKAKRFVRKGIPPEWRGAAWFYYAGGPKILANNQGVYDHMLKRAASGQLKDVCRDDIERDLYRTFPDNVRFRRKAASPAPGQGPSPDPTPAHSRNNSTQSANPPPRAPGSEPEIIDSLRRVLQAFAVFNPSIGYCQSLNFLGGMLLLFVESEEQAFWLLNIITRVYLPGTHEMSLEGSKVDLSVLMAELQDVLPNVWLKISDDGSAPGKKKSRRHRHHKGTPGAGENLPPVTLALTAWFMSCFIGTLPIETTLRVWDVFFYEGSKTLFRIALAIFKAGENEIKAINDPMEVFAVVQSLPRKMLDANLLMEICFKRRSGLNHITAETIDEQRAERKERLHIERKEAIAAAQGNPGIQQAATIAVSGGQKHADMLSVGSGDGVRRKHTLFGRRAHKERGLSEV